MKLRKVVRSLCMALTLFSVTILASSCAQKQKAMTTEEPQVVEPKPTLEEPKPMTVQPEPTIQTAPPSGEMGPAPADEGAPAKMKHKRSKGYRKVKGKHGGGEARVSGQSIIEAMQQRGTFKTFLKALRQAGITKMLRGKGPYTIIAPTDRAAGIDTLKGKKLQDTLYAHILKGRIEYGEIKNMKSVQTWNGRILRIHTEGGKLHVGRAGISKSDIEASNGVILIADAVVGSGGGKPSTPHKKQPADKPKGTSQKKKK